MKIKPVRVLGPRDPKEKNVIMTTSKYSELSPFVLGPSKLWHGHESLTMENAWQYCKVYKEHLDENRNPSAEWFDWAHAGWANHRAVRYPMGKGARPEYSYWNSEKLTYVQARLKIYIPLYAKLVRVTDTYKKIKARYRAGEQITLWDYDGYDYLKLKRSLTDVIFDPTRKMGHAFVIAMLLEKHPIVQIAK